MLGLSSGLIKGASVLRSIVKKGLKAWYKADKTQAPLGEEQIANGDFSVGPDIVGGNLPTFFDNATYFSHANGLVTISSVDGVSAENNAGLLEHSKTYKVTVDVVTLAGSNPRVYLGGVNSDALVEGVNVKYVTTNGSFDHVGFNDAQGTVFRSYTVERANPNDSWTVGVGWAVEDGTATCSSGNANLTQDVGAVADKTYQVTMNVTRTSGTLFIDLGDCTAQNTTSSGVQTFTMKATNSDHLRFYGGVFRGSISNISVKEITNSVRDFSPNTNNGVLYSGKALSFDGSDNYIDIDYWASKTIDANTKATFAVWFNDDNVSAGDFILGSWTVDGEWFYLAVKQGKLDLGWGNSGWTSTTNLSGTLPSVVDDTWYRAVAVVDGLTCKVYLNGEFVFSKTNSSSFTIHSEGISIGAQGNAHGDFWDGELADFQIYDKAWTPSDVTYDYNNPDKDVFDDEGRAEVLGAELITNTWSQKESTVVSTFSNGIRVDNSGGNNNSGPYQNLSLVAGKHYSVTATMKIISSSSTGPGDFTIITSNASGNNQVIRHGGDNDLIVEGVAVTKTVIVEAGDVSMQFSCDLNNSIFEVSNVSVKEVLTHAGEISPTDCTALYRLNEGAGNRIYNAAPVLSAELVSNSDFSQGDNGDFTVVDSTASSITIANGKATYNIVNGENAYIRQLFGIVSGKTYKLSITLKGLSGLSSTSNQVRVQDDIDAQRLGINVNPLLIDLDGTIQTVETIWTAGSGSDSIIVMRNDGGSSDNYSFEVHNLSVKEISLSESYVQENWVANRWITAQPYIPQYAMSSYSKKAIFGGAGSGDYVELGTQKVIPAADPFSFSFWYYNIDESADQPILGRDGSTDDYLVLDGGHEGLIYKANGVSRFLTFNSELTTGKLNHIVLTSAGGEVIGGLKCYVNGVLQTDTENSLSSDFHYRDIMQSQGTFGEGFIDELAHFSKELSATEVREIFNAGMALDCRDHSAFLGDEEFDDPGFDDPSEWSIQNGWIVSGGKASVDNVSSYTDGNDNVRITQLLDGVTAGKMYDISFEISDYIQGSFQFAYGRFHLIGTSTTIPNVQGNGTYKYRVIAQLSDPFHMHLYSYNASKFSIDNVSVKEVNLKGYWRNNGVDTWTDLSPYGNDGTVNGSPTTIQLQEVPYFKKDTFGLPMNRVRQRGLNFDGDSYVEVTDDDSLGTLANGFTCSYWYRHSEDIGDSGSSTYPYIYTVTKGTGLGTHVDNGFGSSVFDNRIYADLNTSDGRHSKSFGVASGLGAPVWYYVTAVYNKPEDDFRLYINADRKSPDIDVTGTFSVTAEARPLRIGTNFSGTFKSRSVIDDVKWYNRALSQAEITKNYKATKSRHSSTSGWSDDFSSDFI